MANLKKAKIGVYGNKTRLLQKRVSYEKTAHTMKTFNIYKYLGSRVNSQPSVEDIQDLIFLETPDRAYATEPVEINGWMEIHNEQVTDYSKFGLPDLVSNVKQFKFHSYSFEADGLGRYIMTGDIIEIPFYEQDERKVFFEVTDVDRKSEYETFVIHVTATPLKDKQETAEISGYGDSLIDELQTQMDTEFNNGITKQGIDTTNYEVDDPKFTEDYDPRPEPASDFLDDPNKLLF